MRKTITLFALFFVFVLSGASAQERTITGKITSSADNLGITGVAVVVVGTTLGTTTNIDGAYSLSVPAGAKQLRFSGVGLKTKTIDIGASNNLDMVMDNDVLKLDEVVVTALGIRQEKKRLAYAVQDVGGEELTKSGEQNVVEGLAGKVAGVQVVRSTGDPGASSFINVRGLYQFDPQSDNQPLFVIDGVPMDNSTLKSGYPDEGVNN